MIAIRKLDRYLFFSFLAPFLLCLVLILSMVIVVETSERLSNLLKYKGPDPFLGLLARYYLCRIPSLLGLVAPIITLSGAIVALARLARQNELMAMQASGISLKRIALPLLGAGVVVAALAAVVQEFVVPATGREMQRVSIKLFGSKGPDPMIYQDVFAVDPKTSFWLTAKELDYRTKTIRSAEADKPSADGSNTSPMRITSGVYRGGRWLVSGKRFVTNENSLDEETFEDLPLPEFTLTPEDLAVGCVELSARSLGELRGFARLFPLRSPQLSTEIHKRLAYPLANVILLLLAVPLVVQPSGQTSIQGIGLAVAATLGYYIFTMAMLDFGVRGYLAPIIAGWLPVVVFAAIGTWMYRRFHG